MELWCNRHYGPDNEPLNLYTDGLKIYTTIDSRLQMYAEEAMKVQMSHLQEVFEKQWKNEDLWKGLSEAHLFINYDGTYRSSLATDTAREMDVFSWKGLERKNYNTLDSLKHYLRFLQTGFLAMDVQSAEIRRTALRAPRAGP